ncbi:multidrug resistance-associated protein 5-like [Antedon mediterranea]|uniref:multidrug resistance-associated protein 5-like n=1 Tax=Antedon mediterranea TaxID=105859 RepID=UPI003AF75F56
MGKSHHVFPVVTGLTSLLQRARVKLLDSQDLEEYSIGERYASEGASRLQQLWDQDCCNNKEKASFVRACFRFIRRQFFFSCVYSTFGEIVGRIGGVMIIVEMLKYVEKQEWNTYKGLVYAFLLLVVVVIRNTINISVLYANSETAVRLQASIMMLLYKRISTLKSMTVSVGEVLNIMTNDGTRIYEAVSNCHVVLRALLVLTAVLIFIINLIGVTALGGVVALLIVIISQFSPTSFVSLFHLLLNAQSSIVTQLLCF